MDGQNDAQTIRITLKAKSHGKNNENTKQRKKQQQQRTHKTQLPESNQSMIQFRSLKGNAPLTHKNEPERLSFERARAQRDVLFNKKGQ